jgi:hypothetical protein
MQVGALQTKPVAQSTSAPQADRQAVALAHANPLQSPTVGVHAPAAQANVVSVAAEQVGVPHVVPGG